MKFMISRAASAAFIMLSIGPALAEWTAAGVACVNAQGYQKEDWQVRRVPEGPAVKTRACLAKVAAEKKRKRGEI
ncbi:hypothetical protein [Bradyrhizobium sp. USDA 3315]